MAIDKELLNGLNRCNSLDEALGLLNADAAEFAFSEGKSHLFGRDSDEILTSYIVWNNVRNKTSKGKLNPVLMAALQIQKSVKEAALVNALRKHLTNESPQGIIYDIGCGLGVFNLAYRKISGEPVRASDLDSTSINLATQLRDQIMISGIEYETRDAGEVLAEISPQDIVHCGAPSQGEMRKYTFESMRPRQMMTVVSDLDISAVRKYMEKIQRSGLQTAVIPINIEVLNTKEAIYLAVGAGYE